MKVLVTGAFGNLGKSTLEALLKSRHKITTLDIKTRATKKLAKKFSKTNEIKCLWGSIQDKSSVTAAVTNQDCIIHLVGVTPPFTENNPDLSYKINVIGTKNIVEVAQEEKNKPKIIFPSSVSIYGPLSPSSKLLTSDSPINPTDVYTRNKAESEEIIQNSALPWTILRITAVPSPSIFKNEINLLYNIPLDQKIEFAHTKDIGTAITNTVTASTEGKILLLGGGKKSQLTNRVFVQCILDTLGLKMLPESVFKIPKRDADWYYTGWMDSKEAQELLDYQSRSFYDYLDEIREKTKFLRLIIGFLKPIVRKILISQSPYYKENLQL